MKQLFKVFFLVFTGITFSQHAVCLDFTEFKDGISWNLRNLTYYQTQNPSAAVAYSPATGDFPNEIVENDFRLDINYSRGPLLIGLKPRADLFWQSWSKGWRAHESEFDGKLYFYEWLVRLNADSKVFAEYGLENLQWGPSTLLSPSNPFDQRNGKDNIYKESISGADYARLIWIPSSSWTISGIANTGRGNKDYYRNFFNTYALKIDTQFQDGYASLIASYRDITDDSTSTDPVKARLGYYAGYNFSDSILSYVEGSYGKNDTEVLVGASYTTDIGPTIGIEYYYNEGGYPRALDQLYLSSFNNLEWRESFLGVNYLLVQTYQKNYHGSFDYVLRWIKNLDDTSNLLNIQMEYGLFDRLSLFGVATVNNGDEGSEFKILRDYQFMGGFEFSF